MRTLRVCALLSFSACVAGLAGCGQQPELINADRLSLVKSIAVLPFEDGPGYTAKNSGTAVTGFITTRLVSSNRYRLVERSKLKSIIDEKDMQLSDLTNPQTAARIGKLLGVQAVIVGNVAQYDMDKTTVYVHVIPVVSKEYKVGASIRVVDVANGEIIYAHSASGVSGNNFTQAGRQAAQKLLDPLLQS